jgi:hypothetical protein
MNLHNLKEASNYEVEEWLIKELNLKKDQQRNLRDQEYVRFAPFYFYKTKKNIKNIWFRLSIIFFPFIWLLLFISLPINFIITGYWGFDTKKLKHIFNWMNNIGL